MLSSEHLQIEIYHAVEYRWPHWKEPYIAWPHQYALWVIDNGTLAVNIGQEQWLLKEDEVFLAPIRQPRHLGAPEQGGVHWWSLNFLPSWFTQIDPLQSLQSPLLLKKPPKLDELRFYMKLLARYWMSPWRKGPLTPLTIDEYRSLLPLHKANFQPHEQIICQGLAHTIFGWCLEALKQNDIPLQLHQSLPPWLSKALSLIEENPSISANDLARIVSFSPTQLRRLFHQWLGASPQDYLMMRRMDRAYHLLETTDLTVSAIAQSLGHSSAPSFARVFKRTYGIAPKELRQALHNRSAVLKKTL